MRIAVPVASNNQLQSPVFAHFGKCPYFILVDVEDNQVKAVEGIANPFFNNHQPGEVPEFISRQNVNVMLAGGMGGRAVEFFNQYGIEAVTGATGTVAQAVQAYLDGQLTGFKPCADSEHHHEH